MTPDTSIRERVVSGRIESPTPEPVAGERIAGIEPHTLHQVVSLAADLAHNGREGRRIGAMFVVGDEDAVLRRSHPLILDPLAGHPVESRRLRSTAMQGTVRELSQLDGAFVVSADGVVTAAARCLDVDTSDVEVPPGLGSRHLAAASITSVTDAIAIVVSQSSRAVRMFRDGRIVDTLSAGSPTGAAP